MSRLRRPVIALGVAILSACTPKQSEPTGSAPPASTTAASTKPSSLLAQVPDSALAASTTPLVAPLLPGETSPTHGPNYFEPREMGSGGISSAFESCLASAQKSDVDLPTEKVVPYCACLADAWRVNTRVASDPDKAAPPTKDQMKTCGATRDGGSPFAFPFPKGTPDLYHAWKDCLEKSPARDHGVYCGCYVDGVFKDPKMLAIAPADQMRCDLADQYWGRNRIHLTVSQFRALLGGPSGLAADAAAPVDAGALRDR